MTHWMHIGCTWSMVVVAADAARAFSVVAGRCRGLCLYVVVIPLLCELD